MRHFLFTFMLALMVSEANATTSVTYAEVVNQQIAPVNWFSGTVTSREHVTLGAEEQGKVEFLADFGSPVEKGETVAKVDDTLLSFQQQTSKLELDKVIEQSKYLKIELDRLKALQKKNSISQTTLDKANHEYALALINIDFARVNLKTLNERVARTQIKAPFSGVVNSLHKRKGEYVSSGEPLLQLVNPDLLEIMVRLPIEVASELFTGSKLLIKSNQEQTSSKATVYKIAAGADEQSRLVEFRLKPEDTHLIPGSPVKVAVTTQSTNQALMVPRDAVVLRQSGYFVFKIKNSDDGKKLVQEVPVNVIFGNDDHIVINGKLSIGDQVAVRGANTLKDGQAVNLTLTVLPLPS